MMTRPYPAAIAGSCCAALVLLGAAGPGWAETRSATLADDAWKDLIVGDRLAGWHQLGGTAAYEVREGAIVGTTAVDTPNSFLCTDAAYGDFILELDFRVDEGLNSGVQIRSQSLQAYRNGIVHGYQVEIDPARETLYSRNPPNLRANGDVVPPGTEPRRWTGGIYDEKRRGWLADLTRNEAARKAFKPGAWNHFRIEAIGDSVRTWINGVFAASIVDSMTPNGFIGLQVHRTESVVPMEVRWKNIRLLDLGFNEAKPERIDPYVGDWQSEDLSYLLQVYPGTEHGYRANLMREGEGARSLVTTLEARELGGTISVSGGGWSGTAANDRIVLSGQDGTISLRRATRTSPTLNAPPPDGAVVLFDGTGVDAWASQKPREWEASDGPADDWRLVAGGRLEAVPGAGSIITRQEFGSGRMHVEFRTLGPVNSGVYVQSRYEIGLKDSYGQLEGSPCGAPGNFSGPGSPAAIPNVAAPPGYWQTLDINFHAPRFDPSGASKEENARISVALNGVQLYEDFEITAVKGAARRLGETQAGPLMLQEHGAPIQFRNIWIVEEAD